MPHEAKPKASSNSDEDLLLAAGRGDASAFEALVERYAGELLGYFRRRIGDDAASDLLQDTLLRLHRGARRYVPRATVRTYLYTIARNVALNYLRRPRPATSLDLIAKGADSPPAKGPTPAETLEASELRVRVRSAVQGLSDPLREVVILRHYQGLPFREVAEVLDIPVGTAMRRMTDALLRLRDRLGDLADQP